MSMTRTTTKRNIEYPGLATDDRGLLNTSSADVTSTSIDTNIKLSIDDHQKPNLEVQVKDNTNYGYLTPDEFDIFRDPKSQARAMDGRILNISKENVADIIAMNGSSNFFHSKKRSDDPPSIDDAAAPSIDGHLESKRSTLHPNRKRKPRWENTEGRFPDHTPGRFATGDGYDSETTRFQAEPSPSIDRRTRPSIDRDYAARRSKMVTEKSLHDKLDEITFPQDLLKEDVYQELKDISETTYARLGMQHRNIGNLQHRMHASELAREILKNQWTRGDEAIRSFIGTCTTPAPIDRHIPVSIDIDISDQLTSNMIKLNLLVLGLGIHWIGILLQVWKGNERGLSVEATSTLLDYGRFSEAMEWQHR
ncbi:hypothetical protein F2Q68_00016269 [Brassica cretica]|uniref:Uncharacterized protein n=1 Tax=Brassica cretica TaxID=69181 RepID=A0A8S9HS91_BRACR|nr:hypothetical protein F2Q68_00016269 [Brassica cretica]